MRKRNKFVAVLSLTAITSLISATVLAKDGDIYDIESKSLKYHFEDAAKSTNIRREVTLKARLFGYEYNGKVYNFREVNEIYNQTYSETGGNKDLTLKTIEKLEKQIFLVSEIGEKVNIEEISNVTNKNITVKLEKKPEAELNINNFIIKVGDEKIKLSKVEKQISDVSGKTYRLVTDELQNKEGKVSVNGVEKEFDFKSPEIVEITSLSGRIFEIRFSEAIDEPLAQIKGSYSMVQTGTAIVGPKIEEVKVKDSTTVRVKVAEKLIKDINYTVTATNIEDKLKNSTGLRGTSGSFVAIEDLEKPIISSAKALDANKIEIVMSKELNELPTQISIKELLDDGIEGKNIYTSGSTVEKDGEKIILTIGKKEDYLKNNTKYKIELKDGTDLSGNAIAENQVIEIIGVRDEIAPEVVGDPIYDGEKKTITINFSKEMKNLEKNNYNIFKSETNLGYTGTIEFNPSEDNKSVVLKLNNKLDGDCTYSIRLKGKTDSENDGLSDASVVENPLKDKTIVKFTTPTVIVPVELNSATQPSDGKIQDGKTVVISFNTELVKSEAENTENYKIVNILDKSKTLKVEKAVYDGKNKTVTLTTEAQEEVVQSSAYVKNYEVVVSNLTNLKVGNDKAQFAGIDKVKPVFTEVKVINKNTIDLVFNKEISGNENLNKISITKKETEKKEEASDNKKIESKEEIIDNKKNNIKEDEGDNKDVKGENTTPEAEDKTESSNNEVVIGSKTIINGNILRITTKNQLEEEQTYIVKVSGVKDKAHVQNTSEEKSIEFIAKDDKEAPKLVAVKGINGAIIELEFNEEIKVNGTLTKDNFILSKNDQVINWGTDTTFEVKPTNSNKVIIINKEGAALKTLFENEKEYTIKVVGNETNGITDLSGNITKEETVNFKGVVDTVKPQLVSAEMGNTDDEVVLTFSENIKEITSNEENKGKFLVTNAETGEGITVSGVTSGTGEKANEVTLTLESKTTAGVEYKVYIKEGSIIKDNEVTPNELDTNHQIASFTGVDKTAPTAVAKKLISANEIIVSFDEKIDSKTVEASDFSVANGENSLSIVKAEVQPNGTDVKITFEGNRDTSLNPIVTLVANESIADLYGNELKGSLEGGTVLVTGICNDEAAPTIEIAEVTEVKEIKVTFSEELADLPKSMTAERIDSILSVGDNTVSSIAIDESNKNVLVITVENELKGNASVIFKAVNLEEQVIKDKEDKANIFAGDKSIIAEYKIVNSGSEDKTESGNESGEQLGK